MNPQTQRWGTPVLITWPEGYGPDGTAAKTDSADSDPIDLRALVDNSGIRAQDFHIIACVETASGVLAASTLLLLVAGSFGIDDAYHYPANRGNWRSVGKIYVNAAATPEYSGVLSLRDAYPNFMPERIKLRIFNNTNLALAGVSGAAAVQKIWIQPITTASVD